MNESQLIRHIKAHIAAGDKAAEKSNNHYIAAGQHLKTLKASHGGTWAEWEALLKEKMGIGKSRASELMQIADGRKTVEQLRAEKAESVRQVEAREKASPLASGENADDPEASAEVMKAAFADEGDTDEVCWRRGLLYRAENAAGEAAYEDWSGFIVDSVLVDAATRAAKAWTDVAGYLGRLRDAQSKSVEVAVGCQQLEIAPIAAETDGLASPNSYAARQRLPRNERTRLRLRRPTMPWPCPCARQARLRGF
jgi:hypothetical protein